MRWLSESGRQVIGFAERLGLGERSSTLSDRARSVIGFGANLARSSHGHVNGDCTARQRLSLTPSRPLPNMTTRVGQ